MAELEKFEFDRSRGVVWVCDLANSSKYLNDNQSADNLEQFLPRLYWIASMTVAAAGGKFIKWTGDGFMAWFETELYRNIGKHANAVFNAAQFLSLMINSTQLGLNPQRKFKIRHGIAYEQDALLIRITYKGGHESLDLIGRAVVLAFRISGIAAIFPGIVTQKELVAASDEYDKGRHKFMKWQPESKEKLKYFKGERWGTESIYVSSNKMRLPSHKSILREAKQAVEKAEGLKPTADDRMQFAEQLLARMANGPEWCREVINDYLKFVKNDLLGNLKAIVSFLENYERAKHSAPDGSQSDA
jgi:class 3 adenylate cyclase